MTTNLAEQYNSIVCKFIGGNRINLSQKGTYKTRCEAAAVSFNSGPEYRRLVYKEMVKKSPEGHTKKYIEKLKRIRSQSQRSCKRKLFKMKRAAPPDEHYGTENVVVIPDCSEEEYSKKEKEFLVALKKTPEEIQRIEEQTRGQANNPLWYKERCHRITASNFKDICSMKKKTSCVNKVKHLLHNSFQGNNSTRYGRRNERRALHEFQEAHNLIVEPCGLFIDEEHYMLGATPDGLVGTDACVEIKCPANAADMHPKDAILQKKIKYAELRNEGDLHLKRIHSYYYQIQGQLHITNRKLCYFIIWTPLGMLIEKIYRDDDFWNTKIVTQLREFYFKCLLPEIIDPRSTRGREIRNPPR
ncbi:exonuclease phage-type/recb c-terminal domain-containing protein [Holotrichia oblita]|uniref:Exonuclease phage-type/recb c-terminal domain-containing protein n=1 Tax=Holotrichia oblita TaxID=644536 RepID=A0ACB9SGD0_HOLOL|nr:exonuclease phage-type/recb c-terminal domain-containing protein [Holotrichia oblita]